MQSIVTDFLVDAGVGADGYSVIQFRGETHGLSYTTCAEHIVVARDLMLARTKASSKMPFVLMSSLNRNRNMTWGSLGSEGYGEAQGALDILLDKNNFLKLDTYMR